MSLKAKLEAVIYAAEEPVTLNQLAALFADEALEWRAEQEKVAAEAEASKRSAVAEPVPMLARTFDYLEPGPNVEQSDEAPAHVEQGAEAGAEPAAAEDAVETAAEAGEQTGELVGAEVSGADAQAPDEIPAEEKKAEAAGDPAAAEFPEASPDASPETSPGLTPEEVAKQAARQRDREVRLVIRELLDELVDEYANEGSGIEIREIAGGYRMGTKPEYHDGVRAFVKSLKPAMKLSLPALETLAVIAYKQPVTAPEVNEIRGVDSSGVFGSLLARKLIATAGRKQVVGRPILYKTTKEFLLRFGLKDVSELPSMEEFEKMAASEFEETEAAESEGEAPAAEETEHESQAEEADEPGAAESAGDTGTADGSLEAASATEAVAPEASNTTLE
jgi:segregation and condensation protein B